MFAVFSLCLAGVLGAAYAFRVERLRAVWAAIPECKPDPGFVPLVPISVLVPARDESRTIGACIESLLAQDYPPELFEIIVIDDHSSDGTARLAGSSGVTVLSLADVLPRAGTNAYKKEALSLGVSRARGELIVCTDADCRLPPQWLRLVAYGYVHRGWHCMTGPVSTFDEVSLLERFQGLDLAGMMLLTAAGIQSRRFHLANGAAFSFSKEAFVAVGGYTDQTHLASGDDLLLMHKIMARFPVGFLKTTTAVRTHALEGWLPFFRQRLRWGTKSRGYSDTHITHFLALVFFLCWGILLAVAAVPFAPVAASGVFILLMGFKAWADYRMLRTATLFFGRQELMRSFWAAQGLHILYIALVGLASNLVTTYTWKGRKVR
ncbi:MAG: glycosyltransferase [Saprospiraceae bacterium]